MKEPMSKKIIAYSLPDIASWSDKTTSEVHIPALQRGLVWRPKQIELLWDSLFRGIPIGSFVVCPYIDAQKRVDKVSATYHLLDGQQRANAIQLGFDDFNQPRNPKGSLLWLDLQLDQLPRNSTRNYLFRVATPAHPWGYNLSDEEGYLGAAEIRNGLALYANVKNPKDPDYVRPKPNEIQPIKAKYPVPVSLLIKVFSENKSLTSSKVLAALQPYNHLPWASNAIQAFQDGTIDSLEKINQGLTNAMETQVLALRAPDELMTISEQEKNNEERDDITNIEHLFQRLNRQGSRLDGEELIYSMIKAYWPKIVQGIDGLEQKLMPASRLVVLAFRVIVTEENWEKGGKIAPDQNVSGIRKLATAKDKIDLRHKIIDFVNGDDELSLHACCKRVDSFLGIGNSQLTWSLPPFLRSALAYENQNLYLLLLLLARKHRNITEEAARLLTGCITWCSWFGSKNITEHVTSLYSMLKDDISPEGIQKAVAASHVYFYPVFTKDEIRRFISLPSVQDAQDWTWWSLVQNDDEAIQARNQIIWNPCVSTLLGNRSFLLYAQRGFLNERFSDYDPARKDLWDEHNRPWDYDHILPYYYTYNQKSNNRFMRFSKEWANNNGNFRAWPFEDNRSDQATLAGEKLDKTTMEKSFIIQEELSGFNQGRQIIENGECALNYASACRKRLLRLYGEWFDSLGIGSLLEAYRQANDSEGQHD